ncbi:MAG: SBBP repeat-containing protein [Verrucomicrobia bacterium]|nr:SBBP repeat-containing protein [Verrucomicrobiota bacterium]
MNHRFRLLLLAAVCLAGAIAPAAAQTTVANPDALFTQKDTPFTFSAAALTTNDVASAANGTNSYLAVSAVNLKSARGGAVGANRVWVNRHNGPVNNSFDTASAVATDNNGNIFVTGYSSGFQQDDYSTIAYSSSGVPLWTNHYNGSANGDDQASGVVVDGSGNVFVTGSSANEFGSSDFATVGYSSAGVPLWTNRYDGPSNLTEEAATIVVASNGNVIMTGRSDNGGGNWDSATVAYSGAGLPLWTNRYSPPTGGYPVSAVDRDGNVFVTGGGLSTVAYSSAGVPLWTNGYGGAGFARDVTVDDSGNVFVTGRAGIGYATMAYSGAGVPLWTNFYNGPGNSTDEAFAIVADHNGNVFVTGYSYGLGTDFDYATLAYSGNGVPLWTNRYSGPVFNWDQAYAIAVDGDGNVFVTGYSTGSSSTGQDFATVAYSSTGALLWVDRYNGPGSSSDVAFALAVDRNNDLYVVGRSYGGVSSYDYAIIKYAAATNSPFITYTPPPGFTGVDTFTYTVTDSLGSNATTTVTVVVVDSIGTPLVSAPANPASGVFQLNLAGAPGSNYVLQASSNLVEWRPIATNTAPASGLFPFSETLPNTATQRFFRVLKP